MNRITISLVSIALWGAVAVAGEKPPKPEQTAAHHRRQGDSYRRAKKYAEAEKAYSKALSLAKEDIEKVRVYQALAVLARQQKKQDGQLAFLREAMEASKKQPDLYAQTTERLVGELVSAKKLDEAEKLAREAMVRGRTDHEKLSFWNHVCVIHQRKRTLAKLEKECATPKGKEPDPLKLLMLKAVYEAKQDPAKIVEVNKEIVKRNPRDGMASRELAEHLVKQGKMKEALPLLESLAGNPGENRRKYAEMLVKHYLATGKDEEAVKWASVLKTPSAATYRKIIRLYLQAKKVDLALAEYDDAVKNAESVDDACQLRLEKARLLKKEGKAAEAAKELKALAESKNCPEHIAAEAKAALKAPAPTPKPAPKPTPKGKK